MRFICWSSKFPYVVSEKKIKKTFWHLILRPLPRAMGWEAKISHPIFLVWREWECSLKSEYPFAKYFLFVIVMSISVCSGTPRPADKQKSDERWWAISYRLKISGGSRLRHNPQRELWYSRPVTVRAVSNPLQAMRAALADRQLGWNSRGVSSLLTVWRLPCAF